MISARSAKREVWGSSQCSCRLQAREISAGTESGEAISLLPDFVDRMAYLTEVSERVTRKDWWLSRIGHLWYAKCQFPSEIRVHMTSRPVHRACIIFWIIVENGVLTGFIVDEVLHKRAARVCCSVGGFESSLSWRSAQTYIDKDKIEDNSTEPACCRECKTNQNDLSNIFLWTTTQVSFMPCVICECHPSGRVLQPDRFVKIDWVCSGNMQNVIYPTGTPYSLTTFL